MPATSCNSVYQTGLVIFHLPPCLALIHSPSLSALLGALGPSGLYHLGSPYLWLPAGFGWRELPAGAWRAGGERGQFLFPVGAPLLCPQLSEGPLTQFPPRVSFLATVSLHSFPLLLAGCCWLDESWVTHLLISLILPLGAPVSNWALDDMQNCLLASSSWSRASVSSSNLGIIILYWLCRGLGTKNDTFHLQRLFFFA